MNAANKPNSPVFKVELNAEDMRLLLTKQKEAWLADGIPDYATRIDRMDRLIALLVGNKDEIAATLSQDYGRRSIEGSLFIEVLNVVSTLKYNKVHLREWMEPELHEAPFPDAVARVEFQPKGVVGVISPWNIPWLLAFRPIASADKNRREERHAGAISSLRENHPKRARFPPRHWVAPYLAYSSSRRSIAPTE
jgi:acyl-CoA reductase-like NAD-dependent aldehyde dehydrogenase